MKVRIVALLLLLAPLPLNASGGTGDVLAGMVGAFLAGGADALSAAVAGAWYHGRAAEEAAFGDGRGLIASDLLAALPLVFPPA